MLTDADIRDHLERLPPGHPSSPWDADGRRRPPPPRLQDLELPLPGHWPGGLGGLGGTSADTAATGAPWARGPSQRKLPEMMPPAEPPEPWAAS